MKSACLEEASKIFSSKNKSDINMEIKWDGSKIYALKRAQHFQILNNYLRQSEEQGGEKLLAGSLNLPL
jgi:hypothetical protein